MRRVAVKSTSIASIGYDASARELEIEYRESGDVYLFSGVPDEEHTAFMAAESKGAHLNRVFKLRGHRFIKLR